MELESLSEFHDHAEYVHWNHQGSPERPENYDDWSPDCAQGQDTQWHDDTQRLAAIAEADAYHRDTVDAINGKGGKGGKSKGKR